MDQIDRAHGATRLGLLIAAGVAVLAALAVVLVTLNGSGRGDSGPPVIVPTTSEPAATSVPTTGESATPTSRPSGPPTSQPTGG